MAIIEGIIPPSRENWELINYLWQFFPLITTFQYVVDWYPMGKTSGQSRLNLPGKWAWFTMEAPGFLTLLYIMFTLPRQLGIDSLPWPNWTMAGMFTIHYTYRAILSPLLLNPSMSPIHPLVWAMALAFQLTNATCLGGWLAGYGPTHAGDWAGRLVPLALGTTLWAWGLLGNAYHEDELREIRRAAARRAEAARVDKVYLLPHPTGLFRWILFPHYLCEWIEWAGFWLVAGAACTPARSFLFNEIATMLPRALQQRRWYLDRFGAEKVGGRKAVIPGIL